MYLDLSVYKTTINTKVQFIVDININDLIFNMWINACIIGKTIYFLFNIHYKFFFLKNSLIKYKKNKHFFTKENKKICYESKD